MKRQLIIKCVYWRIDNYFKIVNYLVIRLSREREREREGERERERERALHTPRNVKGLDDKICFA